MGAVLDEKFSNLEIKGLPHIFSISTYMNRYYIYYFDKVKKQEIDSNLFNRIRDKMILIAGMADREEFDYYYIELQNLLDFWKQAFPIELKEH